MSLEKLPGVRLIAFDVDGVFTDGRFYLSDEGVESKAFHTQDGYGIRQLITAGISVAVISGRRSGAVERRMQELGVPYIVQGCKDKVAALDAILAELGITPDECAYVGDDVPDLPLLRHVGVSIAVANAVATVRMQCDYLTTASGGAGAVREVCELLLSATGHQRLISSRTIVLLVILGAAAIGSWYLGRNDRAGETSELPYENVHRGYYLKSARILGTADNGTLLYAIEADHAEQRADRRIDFTEVRIRYSPDSNVPWTVNADAATLSEGSPRIVLRGHVRATSSGPVDEDETEIRTQYLELDPERFVAETDERVQIRIGARSLTATGMLASLRDNKIELKSNIRGKIAP